MNEAFKSIFQTNGPLNILAPKTISNPVLEVFAAFIVIELNPFCKANGTSYNKPSDVFY